jgi:hypothetical protein
MAITPVACPVCGHQVYRNARGQILGHTTPASGGRNERGYGDASTYRPAEKCPGSTPGARP